jgi:hypothetical protein
MTTRLVFYRILTQQTKPVEALWPPKVIIYAGGIAVKNRWLLECSSNGITGCDLVPLGPLLTLLNPTVQHLGLTLKSRRSAGNA